MGFGVCDVHGAALTYDLPAQAGNLGHFAYDTIVPTSGGAGSGNAAQQWFNSQLCTRIFDPQGQWSINFDLMPFYQVGTPSAWAQVKFLQLASASSNILALELETDGTIAVVTGGNGQSNTGTIVKRTTQTFPVFQWASRLELFATGFGGSTVVTMWQNDVLILSVTVATTDIPDRISLGLQNGPHFLPYFGLTFANLVFTDGQGPAPCNTRLGPVRVSTFTLNGDAGGNWNITPNTLPFRYEAVADLLTDRNGSPDFDSSYISPVAIGDKQWFTVSGVPCYGLILSVMVNLVFRGSTGSTTCDALLLQQSSTTNLGTAVFSGPLGSYRTKQILVALSPGTGTFFTDGEIAGSLWGVSTASPGLLLTQMFLEKVVSLRSTPFNCGQSSYSF
jgi:hypothetical protein